MREANWDEIFQRRADDSGDAEQRLSSVLPWEDWLTLSIVVICFMSVVHSINSANWVDDMPSLYPTGLSAIAAGYALARIRWREGFIHPIALFAGATLVFLQLLAILPGGTPAARVDNMLDRMHDWWSAVTQHGISGDPLPFVILVLVLTWLGSYASTWAIFRWRNAWLGLVPGGTALMWNISFIPGQFSFAFVVFLFAAVLLVMRLHIATREREWEDRHVPYPEFLSLSVLNVTFWVTLLLLVLVLRMPLADRSDSANDRWSKLTDPITERVAPLSRVFISVNAKKPIEVHNLDDALAFQGKIALNNERAVDIDVELTPEMAAFLRARSYDEYTRDGWKGNTEGEAPLAPGDRTNIDQPADGTRKDVTIDVTVTDTGDQHLYSLGQPLSADADSNATLGGNLSDVTSLEPEGRLRKGDTYSVTGSVAVASIEQLQSAGEDYPAWVTERYLALPPDLPRRIARKAREVTGPASTPYDKAAEVERYLRTFPVDFAVPDTPPGRDSVDYFLFDLQRGYFDYHASAMAVMLRTLGVPSRVATGYALDDLQRDGDGTTYEVTEKKAFAWPEVYFPGVGWVEFSPTPSEPRINRPGTAQAPPATGSDRGTEDEAPIDIPLGDPQVDPAAPPLAETGDDGSGLWRQLLILAGIGGVAALLFGGARFAWEYGLGGLPRPVQLWEKTQRLARAGKSAARPTETPREFARRLRAEVPRTGSDATYLAAAYERARFGRKELDEEETERLESAWQTVRNELLRRALRFRR